MRSNHHGLLQNAGLRLAGLGLIALSAFSASRLYHMVHVIPLHEATPFEMIVAAVAFFAASCGGMLLFLGTHIFDTVEISPRWAPARNRGQAAIDQSE